MEITSVELYGKFFGSRTCFLCRGTTDFISAEDMCKADLRFTYLGDLINTETREKTCGVIRFQKKCYSTETVSVSKDGCVLQFRAFKVTGQTKPFNEKEYPYYIDILECAGGEETFVLHYKTVEELLEVWNMLSDEVHGLSLHNIPSEYIS